MELQVGKRYRMRNGMVTEALINERRNKRLDWFETRARVDGYIAMWEIDGTANFFGDDRDHPYDIIAEYTE